MTSAAHTHPKETPAVDEDQFAEIDQAIKHVYLTELSGAVKRAVDERLREMRTDPGAYGMERVALPKEVLALPVAPWYVSEGRAGFWTSRTVDEGHTLLAECPSFEAAERVSEGLQALTEQRAVVERLRVKAVIPKHLRVKPPKAKRKKPPAAPGQAQPRVWKRGDPEPNAKRVRGNNGVVFSSCGLGGKPWFATYESGGDGRWYSWGDLVSPTTGPTPLTEVVEAPAGQDGQP